MAHIDYDRSWNLDGVSGQTTDEVALKLTVGDRVDFGGMEGTVRAIDELRWDGFPVLIEFDSGYKMHTTLDGKTYSQQKHSVLKVIGKENRKLTKKYVYAVKYSGDEWKIADVYLTETEALLSFGHLTYGKIQESEIEDYV